MASGERGGALIYRTSPSNPWYQVGISSAGTGCTGDIDLFTKITSYTDWIKENLEMASINCIWSEWDDVERPCIDGKTEKRRTKLQAGFPLSPYLI